MRTRFLLLTLAGVLSGCAGSHPPAVSPEGYAETGQASYYADAFQGRTTASGEAYERSALTAAHRTLPFGTRVAVTNLANDRTVIVRINDRGPFVKGRIIDVSYRAAVDLDFVREGVTQVRVVALPPAE
jgi:rare lipoprotein A